MPEIRLSHITMNTPQFNTKDVKSLLSAAGIQITPQRLRIARFVLNSRSHPTVKEVMDGVRKDLDVVNQATIYNTLNKLVEHELIREVRTQMDDSVRYDGNREPHHHLIDPRSGALIDIPFDEIQIANLEELKRRYQIDDLSVTIQGALREDRV